MKITKTILMLLAVGVVAFATTSCTEEEPYVPEWEWGEGSGGGNTENPDDGGNTENPDDGGNTENPDDGGNTDTPVEPAELKPRFLWIDAAANFHDYANDKEKIAADLAKVAETGFTDIIVDVRPTMGDVLFKTTHTEQVKRLASWNGGSYHWEERTATWDYLQAFIDAAHEVGLKVHAGFNTMACGNDAEPSYGLEAQGMVYRDAAKRDWVTVLNLEAGLTNMMDAADYGTKFLNPANDEAVDFLCNLLKDLAAYEDLDGIILDRCRFDNIKCDFSDISRQKFETYIGKTVENWPNDILEPTKEISIPTALQKQWLEFRAKVIHDFIEKAAAAVRSVNTEISFGAYVGGWYSTYYNEGVNWASPNYAVSSHYPWASLGYKNYGYADHLDVLLIGAYASTSSIYGGSEWSVQGFCKLAHDKVMGDCLVAGGPDIGNPTGWPNGGKSAEVTKTVDAAINACDGYFCFDLIHVKMYNYWAALKKGIDAYIEANK